MSRSSRPHPPRLQHSPSLPNIWFPPHSGPIPRECPQLVSVPRQDLHLPSTPPLRNSSLPPQDNPSINIQRAPDDTPHLPKKARSQRSLKSKRLAQGDHFHEHNLLTPPLTPSSSIRTSASTESTTSSAASHHLDIPSGRISPNGNFQSSFSVTNNSKVGYSANSEVSRFLMIRNICRTIPNEELNDLICDSFTAVNLYNSHKDNSYKSFPCRDSSSPIVGVFLRFKESHGVVILAFFDTRCSHAAARLLDLGSNEALSRCFEQGDNDDVAKSREKLAVCRFINQHDLVKMTGDPDFLRTVTADFRIHVFSGENSLPSEDNVKRLLQDLLSRYGDWMSLTNVNEGKIRDVDDSVPQFTFQVEFYDFRDSRVAFKELNGTTHFGLRFISEGLDGLDVATDALPLSTSVKHSQSTRTSEAPSYLRRLGAEPKAKLVTMPAQNRVEDGTPHGHDLTSVDLDLPSGWPHLQRHDVKARKGQKRHLHTSDITQKIATLKIVQDEVETTVFHREQCSQIPASSFSDRSHGTGLGGNISHGPISLAVTSTEDRHTTRKEYLADTATREGETQGIRSYSPACFYSSSSFPSPTQPQHLGTSTSNEADSDNLTTAIPITPQGYTYFCTQPDCFYTNYQPISPTVINTTSTEYALPGSYYHNEASTLVSGFPHLGNSSLSAFVPPMIAAGMGTGDNPPMASSASVPPGMHEYDGMARMPPAAMYEHTAAYPGVSGGLVTFPYCMASPPTMGISGLAATPTHLSPGTPTPEYWFPSMHSPTDMTPTNGVYVPRTSLSPGGPMLDMASALPYNTTIPPFSVPMAQPMVPTTVNGSTVSIPAVDQEAYAAGLDRSRAAHLQTNDGSPSTVNAVLPLDAANGNNVPRDNQLVLENIEAGRDTRSTVMIKNIPNKMSDKDLMNFIAKVCPRKIDFLYLRMDFQNGCNVGYAFVNFIYVEDLLLFAKKRLGQKWNMFSSEKILQMSYANFQGKEALVEKFKNSCIMDEREAWQPKIFYSEPGPNQGLPEPFPPPTHLRRKERSSHNRTTLFVTNSNGTVPPTAAHPLAPTRRRLEDSRLDGPNIGKYRRHVKPAHDVNEPKSTPGDDASVVKECASPA